MARHPFPDRRQRPRRPDNELANEIVAKLLAAPHAYESADGFAQRIGLRNRHQMNRILRAAGLPSYRTLSCFTRVLSLKDDADAHRGSLGAEATACGYEPAWAYRSFKRITGRLWSDIKLLRHDELIALALERTAARR